MDPVEKKDSRKFSANCKSCGNIVSFGIKPKDGNFLVCPSCGIDLVITSLTQATLDWAFEEDKQRILIIGNRSFQTGENA